MSSCIFESPLRNKWSFAEPALFTLSQSLISCLFTSLVWTVFDRQRIVPAAFCAAILPVINSAVHIGNHQMVGNHKRQTTLMKVISIAAVIFLSMAATYSCFSSPEFALSFQDVGSMALFYQVLLMGINGAHNNDITNRRA